jgi:hypothetical protein
VKERENVVFREENALIKELDLKLNEIAIETSDRETGGLRSNGNHYVNLVI